MSIRKLVKKIPLAKWFAHNVWYRLFPVMGKWLHNEEFISFFFSKDIKKQFPFIYRLFFTYCQIISTLMPGKESIFGARSLLRFVIWFNKTIGGQDFLELKLDEGIICLDLFDPRMLVVPSEVTGEEAETNILKKFLTNGDTFIDVGSNHGSYSFMASRLVGEDGMVVAIEPQPKLSCLVERMLNVNNKSRYMVHQIALGNEVGEIELFIPTGSSGSSGIFAGYSAQADHTGIKVPLKRFDDYLDWPGMDEKIFVKLDIEGSEFQFLKGAVEFLKSKRPPVLLEINKQSMEAGEFSIKEIIDFFKGVGYTKYQEIQSQTGRHLLKQLPECISIEKLTGIRNRNVIIHP